MLEILRTDKNKVKGFNTLSMDNTKVNGTKVLSMGRVPSNTKRVTHIKANGSIIASMERGHTYNMLWSTANKNLTNTLDSLKKAFTLERELWNIGMVTNMMVNGLSVKKKVKECTNGPMGTIMMEVGKKILHKAQALLVLVAFSTMASFT